MDPVSIAGLALTGIGITSTVKALFENATTKVNKEQIDILKCSKTLDDCSSLLRFIQDKNCTTMNYIFKRVTKLTQLLEGVRKILEGKDQDEKPVKGKTTASLFEEIELITKELLGELTPSDNDVVKNVIEVEDGVLFWKHYFGEAEKASLQSIVDGICRASEKSPEYELDIFFPGEKDEVDRHQFARFAKIVSSCDLIRCGEQIASGSRKDWKDFGPYKSLSDAIDDLVKQNGLHEPVIKENVKLNTISDTPVGKGQKSKSVLPRSFLNWVEVINRISPFFHGLLKKSDLRDLFPKSQDSSLVDGFYLLRYSTNPKNTATFSFVKDRKIRNIAIYCSP